MNVKNKARPNLSRSSSQMRWFLPKLNNMFLDLHECNDLAMNTMNKMFCIINSIPTKKPYSKMILNEFSKIIWNPINVNQICYSTKNDISNSTKFNKMTNGGCVNGMLNKVNTFSNFAIIYPSIQNEYENLWPKPKVLLA